MFDSSFHLADLKSNISTKLFTVSMVFPIQYAGSSSHVAYVQLCMCNRLEMSNILCQWIVWCACLLANANKLHSKTRTFQQDAVHTECGAKIYCFDIFMVLASIKVKLSRAGRRTGEVSANDEAMIHREIESFEISLRARDRCDCVRGWLDVTDWQHIEWNNKSLTLTTTISSTPFIHPPFPFPPPFSHSLQITYIFYIGADKGAYYKYVITVEWLFALFPLIRCFQHYITSLTCALVYRFDVIRCLIYTGIMLRDMAAL